MENGLPKFNIYTKCVRSFRVKLHQLKTYLSAIKIVLRNPKISQYINDAKYVGDGIITKHSIDLLKTEKFANAYQDSFELVPNELTTIRDILWRSHIYNWCYNHAKNLNRLHTQADFVELGVWYGILSKAALNMNMGNSSNFDFYLCDPWGDQNHLQKIEKSKKYKDDIFEIVQNRFNSYSNVKLLRGIVPDILEKIPSNKIAFLSIDMNSSKPERSALEFFWTKIVPGGVIYLDDYGDSPDLRNEVDDFLADKEETLLYFPTGQAVIIKNS